MAHMALDGVGTSNGALDFYVPILKSVDHADGTCVVYGKITGDDLDLDQQRVKREWARTAVPEWHERAGNIREMHQPSAIGKSLSWEEQDDGFYIRAEIVDAGAQRKVARGVYGGFSIGVKDAHVSLDSTARKGIIDGGRIVEVSLVDAPALPSARVKEVLWKSVEADPLPAPEGADPILADISAGADLAKSGTEPPKEPPKGYPEDKRQYADPETYGFPLDSKARIRSAMAYYNAGKGKAGREERWEAIGHTIAAAAKRAFGGTYTLQGGDIVGGKDAKSVLRDTLLDGAVILLDAAGQPVTPNTRAVEKDAAATDEPAGAGIEAADDYAPSPMELRDAFRPAPPQERAGAAPGNQDGDDLVPPQFRTPSAPPTMNPSSTTKDVADLGDAGTRSERERFSAPAGAPTLFTPTSAPDAFPLERPEITPNQPGDQPVPMVKTTADRALTLRALIGDLAVIEKNGVQTALGPIVSTMIFQMLAEEVEEDGGSGTDAEDIFEIAKAYCAVCCFRDAENAEPDMGHAPVLPVSITHLSAEPDADTPARRYATAVKAAHDALSALAPDICAGITKTVTADVPAGPSEDEIAQRVAQAVAAAVTEATAPLNDALHTITGERDALQKRLDEEPDPAAELPIRMVLRRQQGIPEVARARSDDSPAATDYLAKVANAQTPAKSLAFLNLALTAPPKRD